MNPVKEKESRPLVTVIVPHKNTPEKLARALNSIPNHVGQMQVIVVDDGSDPGREADKLAVQFPYVQFLVNYSGSANAGAARNVALAYARGEWLIFLDADDYFDINMLSVLLDRLPSLVAYDCVFFKSQTDNSETVSARDRHSGLNRAVNCYLRYQDDRYLRYSCPTPWGKAIRRQLVEIHAIRFDQIVASNDVMFSLKVGFYATSVTALDLNVYQVTVNQNSLSATLTARKALARLDGVTRRNLFVLAHQIPRRLDYGLTYFIFSKPWKINSEKLFFYRKYFRMQFIRLQKVFNK